MSLGFHVVEDVRDFAVRTDDEAGARDAHHLLAIHVLFFDNAKGIANFLVYVRKKRVGQIVLFLEFFLGLRLVSRDAEHHRAGILEFLVGFAEPASFYGSTGRVGFRKEEKNHALAAEVLQRDVFSVLIRQSKLGGFIINIHG
jgi:hypothetical protein